MPLEAILRCSTPDTKEIPPFSLVQRRIYVDTHLKEEPTERFWKMLGIPYPHRQSRETVVNTLLMVLLPLYNLVVYPKRTEYFGAKPAMFLPKGWQKKHIPTCTIKSLISFSIDVAMKITVSVNWCTTSVPLCSWSAASKMSKILH